MLYVAFPHNLSFPAMADEHLQTELATYRRKLPELLNDAGKFVVIRGERVLGTYGSYEDALKAGYQEFKLEPFFVKKISAIEPLNFSSRLYKTAA